MSFAGGFQARLYSNGGTSEVLSHSFTVPPGHSVHLQNATASLPNDQLGSVALNLYRLDDDWADIEFAPLAIWDARQFRTSPDPVYRSSADGTVRLSAWCGPGNWALRAAGIGSPWSVGVTGVVEVQGEPAASDAPATETVAGLDVHQATRLALSVNSIVDVGLILLVTALALRFTWRSVGRLF